MECGSLRDCRLRTLVGAFVREGGKGGCRGIRPEGGHHMGTTKENSLENKNRTPRANARNVLKICGAPGRNRTCGLQLRRLSLYPTELRAHALSIVCVRPYVKVPAAARRYGAKRSPQGLKRKTRFKLKNALLVRGDFQRGQKFANGFPVLR